MPPTLCAQLDAIAEKASRFTTRTLRWWLDNNMFCLGDDTIHGNLALVLVPEGYLHESYMRTRHFGLVYADCVVIKQALTHNQKEKASNYDSERSW